MKKLQEFYEDLENEYVCDPTHDDYFYINSIQWEKHIKDQSKINDICLKYNIDIHAYNSIKTFILSEFLPF